MQKKIQDKMKKQSLKDEKNNILQGTDASNTLTYEEIMEIVTPFQFPAAFWQGSIIPLPSGRTGWESGKLRKCETKIMGGYLL